MSFGTKQQNIRTQYTSYNNIKIQQYINITPRKKANIHIFLYEQHNDLGNSSNIAKKVIIPAVNDKINASKNGCR